MFHISSNQNRGGDASGVDAHRKAMLFPQRSWVPCRTKVRLMQAITSDPKKSMM